MINRYSREKISKIWTRENKFNIWLKIECLIAEKLAINGKIPKKDALNIKKRAKFNIKEIEKIEEKTKHEVIAFINNVSSYIGESSKYFHHGITSSDIMDTAFSVQLKQSSELIIKELVNLLKVIKIKALKHKNTIMIGRTHGIHAEPITFGLKLATFYSEFKRNLTRLEEAKKEISICAISGPVGTYNSVDPSIESFVAKKMGLNVEKISTQIIPRDRHAVYFSVLGILASSIERLATEIRHLQRTEILEVEEYFEKNQTGSSAMPHKKNPILSENLTGLSRYIRSAVIPSMENIALWHERDISHSSVERILAPDITIATDFSLSRMINVIKNLKVYPKNMEKNLNLLDGLHYSQDMLLKLTQKGMSRQIAYKHIQKAAIESWSNKKNFKKLLKNDKKLKEYISAKEIENILSSKDKIKNLDKIFKKILSN